MTRIVDLFELNLVENHHPATLANHKKPQYKTEPDVLLISLPQIEKLIYLGNGRVAIRCRQVVGQATNNNLGRYRWEEQSSDYPIAVPGPG